jgi:dTMP kinase
MDAATLAGKLAGKFIVLDGPDGAGKSTQRARLAEDLQRAGGVVASCRDPGGTAIGERIRSVLLDHDLSAMDVRCETLLFMASRAQLVAEVIRPALAAGRIVLGDRYVSSTVAYQGAAGLDPRQVLDLARLAVGDCWPHLTIVLDVEAETGLARIAQKHAKGVGRAPDAMEARPIEFHRRVRQLLLELPAIYPSPVALIDGRADEWTVHRRIWECLSRVIH